MQRTLRSGFSVQYKGHVVVIGDVNLGAEIIASGSIVIWGRLAAWYMPAQKGMIKRPSAHWIYPQHNFGSQEDRLPLHSVAGRFQPETARLINGQVVAEVWESRKARGRNYDSESSNHHFRKRGGWENDCHCKHRRRPGMQLVKKLFASMPILVYETWTLLSDWKTE